MRNTQESYKTFAIEMRKTILNMVHEANASHVGGAFSMVEILTVLYNKILNVDPKNPHNPERDRFLLSKGHACSGLYTVLAMKGFYSKDELKSFGKNGSYFTTHINYKVPGIELSTGSLGHALSVGCGLALAAKKQGKKWKTFVMVSDGELDEGSNWESILFAPHHKLDNLVLMVDYNKIQSLGDVKEVLDLHPLADKFRSFNWDVQEINGHQFDEIEKAFEVAINAHEKPVVIIAHTIKGKGIDYMENKLLWHYKSPTKEQLEEGLRQIENGI